MSSLSWIIPELSRAEWMTHACIFTINIALLVFARPLLNIFDANRNNETTLKIFRYLNILILILHVLDVAFLSISNQYENYFIKLGYSLAAIYCAIFLYSLLCFLSRKRFGSEKNIDDKKIFLDTYSSRLIDLLFLIVMVFTAIYTLIKIWGADSMLETTGIFGITAALAAFTSNIWAPDIISGLIILNTQILEDGDVVVVGGNSNEYIINKVSLVYVVLYDVRNNHRTLIRNSEFIKHKIENLSRMASRDGLRHALVYKIGYPSFSGASADERRDQLRDFKNKINKLFTMAFAVSCENKLVKINRDKTFEWALTATRDSSLEYTLWVYLERMPDTKVTATIRKHLMGTMFLVNEAVYSASVIENIELATPMLNHVDLVVKT